MTTTRCPACEGTNIEQTCMGGPLFQLPSGLDWTNRGTCQDCGHKGPVASFQLYAKETNNEVLSVQKGEGTQGLPGGCLLRGAGQPGAAALPSLRMGQGGQGLQATAQPEEEDEVNEEDAIRRCGEAIAAEEALEALQKPEEATQVLPLNRKARRALEAAYRRSKGLRRPGGTLNGQWYPRRSPTPPQSERPEDLREGPGGG